MGTNHGLLKISEAKSLTPWSNRTPVDNATLGYILGIYLAKLNFLALSTEPVAKFEGCLLPVLYFFFTIIILLLLLHNVS